MTAAKEQTGKERVDKAMIKSGEKVLSKFMILISKPCSMKFKMIADIDSNGEHKLTYLFMATCDFVARTECQMAEKAHPD